MKLAHAKTMVIGMTALGFASMLALILLIILPTHVAIRVRAQEIRQAQAELDAQYRNRRQLLQSIQQIETLRGTLVTLSAQYLRPGEELTFITAVEDIAAKRSIIQRIRLTTPEEGAAGPVEFDIALEGPFRSVLAGIMDIERLTFVPSFAQVTTRTGRSGREGEPTNVSVSLRGALTPPPPGL